MYILDYVKIWNYVIIVCVVFMYIIEFLIINSHNYWNFYKPNVTKLNLYKLNMCEMFKLL